MQLKKQLWVKRGSILTLGLSFGALYGALFGAVAMGSVPSRPSQITDDTVLYQKLSDISVAREPAPDFDGDLLRLSAAEGRYKENLTPVASHPRVKSALQRIAAQPYRPVAGRSR